MWAAIAGFFTAFPKMVALISSIWAAIASGIALWAIKSKSKVIDAGGKKAVETKDTSGIEDVFKGRQ